MDKSTSGVAAGSPPATAVPHNHAACTQRADAAATAEEYLAMAEEAKSPAANEYRRSLRKKSMRFGLLDFLDKSRKSSKINSNNETVAVVTESSNCPFTMVAATTAVISTTSTITTTIAITTTLASTTAITTVTTARALATHSPSPLIESLIMPNSTQSLTTNNLSIVVKPLLDLTMPDKPILPRKRGRPRKIQPLVHLNTCNTASLVHINNHSASYNSNSANSSKSLALKSASSIIADEPKVKQLRVVLKRMQIPSTHQNSSNSDGSMHTALEPMAKVKSETETETEIKTETISLPTVDNDISNSQIMTEIQTETENCVSDKPHTIMQTEGEELVTSEKATHLSVTVEDHTLPLTQAQGKQQNQLKSTTNINHLTQFRRRSKRSIWLGSVGEDSLNNGKMTLEETFAEIAANSSRCILERASVEKLTMQLLNEDNSNIDLNEDSDITNISNTSPFKLTGQQSEGELNLKSEMTVPENICQLETDNDNQLDSLQCNINEIQMELNFDNSEAQMHELVQNDETTDPVSTSVSTSEPSMDMDIVNIETCMSTTEMSLEMAQSSDSSTFTLPNDNQEIAKTAETYLMFSNMMESEKMKQEKQNTEEARVSSFTTLTRRNTICKDRFEEQNPSVIYNRRSSIPLAAAESKKLDEPRPKSTTENVESKSKTGKKLEKTEINRRDSIDSSSSEGTKPDNPKDSLQGSQTETETESSESNSLDSQLNSCGIPTPTNELEVSESLKDIAQFIEDGMKLLKHDEEQEQQTLQQEQQEQQQQEQSENEYAQRVANIETPATTPSSSPQHNGAPSCNDESISINGGVRRSHRIKKKPKPNVSRGVTNVSVSVSSASISMEGQMAELAHIDAINEKFLRHENLNNFQMLRDNYYRCARQVSQENAEMQCDCFLTTDEEAMGHLCCGFGCINRMLMIECGPMCPNRERCTNKRFQLHQAWPCRVFRTEKKGCGITAELKIPPGEFITEYVGEVIDSEEFERRQHLYSRDRNRHYYFMALRGEAIIDATAKGNISRYINHSCDPNAETQKWTVNGELRIGFFSIKTILPGEEITFDYQYQRYGRDAQRCFCEAANCRGWIGGEPDSNEVAQLYAESESEGDEPYEQDLDADKLRSKTKAIKCNKSKSSNKQLKQSNVARKNRKEQPKAKDREFRAGRWLPPTAARFSGSGSHFDERSVARKIEILEDPDVLEQLKMLKRSGLKNQSDTLRLSRCMVRAKLLRTRLKLLGVLSHGELPCRRLFLDYHGLRLLHAWISESGSDKQLRLALLDALESLPIPNKTMLKDSRVYTSVELWTTTAVEDGEKPTNQSELEPVHQRMLTLLQKWKALPEIFRIPKRERMEQMKEHEREADQPKQPEHVVTALEDSNSNSDLSTLGSDRYRQDRFRRDTTSRYEKPKQSLRMNMSGNNGSFSTNSHLKERNGNGMDSTGNNNGYRRSDPVNDTRRIISKELRRSLFERKVAQDEAVKRHGNEHEVRCEYFGADKNTDPKQLPLYLNTETNEWFNSDDKPVPAPIRCGTKQKKPNEPHSPEIIGGVEYKLPAHVKPLPDSWHWSVTPTGDIYYYNLRDRVPQWEPPNEEQRKESLLDEDWDNSIKSNDDNTDDLVDIDSEYVNMLSKASLSQYIEAKVRERRENRRKRLVSVCLISPRRDEDRIYYQQESHRYKLNKEKIRRRKEIYQRQQNEANNAAVNTSHIKSYLYSSDEDADGDPTNTARVLNLLDAIVDGIKETRVDELEAPNRCFKKKETSPLYIDPTTSKSTQANKEPIPKLDGDVDALTGTKRKLPMPPNVSKSEKIYRSERDKIFKSLPSDSSSGYEPSEKFREEISAHVGELLRPYRKDSCQIGRITSDDDYKFLVNRLSQHITTKETRYCELAGHPLALTESVKHKSHDFVKQYMRKKGRVYRKPAYEPDC